MQKKYTQITESQKDILAKAFIEKISEPKVSDEVFWSWINLWHSERKLLRDEHYCNKLHTAYTRLK